MIDEKHLLPLWDQVLDFMDAAVADQEASQTKIADLSQKLVESDRLILEKVASAKESAKADFFPPAAVDHTLERLVELHILRSQDCAKIAAEVHAKPSRLLTLLENISESLVFHKEGMGIPKSTDSAIELDPDGWGDWAAGRTVQLKTR